MHSCAVTDTDTDTATDADTDTATDTSDIHRVLSLSLFLSRSVSLA